MTPMSIYRTSAMDNTTILTPNLTSQMTWHMSSTNPSGTVDEHNLITRYKPFHRNSRQNHRCYLNNLIHNQHCRSWTEVTMTLNTDDDTWTPMQLNQWNPLGSYFILFASFVSRKFGPFQSPHPLNLGYQTPTSLS